MSATKKRRKMKSRYVVSLSKKTVLFFRIEYGGDTHSLSKGIENAAKMFYNPPMKLERK